MTTDTHVVTLIGGEADGRRIQVQGWPRELDVFQNGATVKYFREEVAEHRHFGADDITPMYVVDGMPVKEALRKLLQGYRA